MPLQRKVINNVHLVAIMEFSSKMIQTEQIRNVTELNVARYLCYSWVFPYGPPHCLISSRGSQLISQLFQNKWKNVCIRQAITSEYHRRTKDQVELFNRNIRSLFSENGTNRDL